MDNNRNRSNDHLGISKISRNIRKSPLHQPTFPNPKPPPQQQHQQQQQQQQNSGGNQQPPPQPQVYNINKNDFRSLVQQLTGTPTRDPSPTSNRPMRPPAHNPPKPPSMRLQKIRPPPLTPIARPPLLLPLPHPNPHPQPHPVNPNPNPSFYPRPPPVPIQSPAIPFSPLLPPTPPTGSAFWGNTLESPISAYMRQLENSILSSDGSTPVPLQMPANPPHQLNRQPLSQMQPLPPSSQSVHQPLPPPPQQDQDRMTAPPSFSTGLLPNPHIAPPLPTSGGLLPSPTSQFILPSPSAFLNLLSPRSPFPLLSPKFQYPPLSPSFAFSPLGGQSGILGPGPQLPPSPHMLPLSPSGFLMSPRWRDL